MSKLGLSGKEILQSTLSTCLSDMDTIFAAASPEASWYLGKAGAGQASDLAEKVIAVSGLPTNAVA